MKCVMLLVIAGVIAFGTWVPASAQGPGNLPENHYLVYDIARSAPFPVVQLRDQFGTWNPGPMTLWKWGNPLDSKNGVNVMWDPLVHHVWYNFDQPIPQGKLVKVQHQFGIFDLKLGAAVFLINPADKNDQIVGGWPDWANHYLCYTAEGPPLGLAVDMQDQWGNWPNTAHEPYCFCNPAEKTDASGQVYPIIDPTMHLTCYRLDPVTVSLIFDFDDQFGSSIFWPAEQQCLLCLPSHKLEVVPTEDGTWGRIKSLYGE